MSEPVHEEEALRQVVRAGEMVTQIRLRRGGTRVPAEIARLRAAGYTEATVHDDVLRGLLGEEKWAAYVADPARLAAAAAITDGDRAGYDMPAVLARAVHARGWEHDVSPSRSVAQVLHYRVKQELAKTGPGMASAAVRQERAGTRDRSAPDRIAWSAAVSRGRAVSTPFDGKLRDLLGEQRWQSYASDPGRADVAALIRRADNEGRAIGELLADVVNMRLFEDDPASPARSVADVLHYRLDRALGKPAPGDARAAAAQLPDEVAGLLGDGIAPAGGQPWQGARADPAGQQVPRSVREARCPPQGRDGR